MSIKKPLVVSGGHLEELQSGDALDAQDLAYDNSGTQMSATTVQDALSELDVEILLFSLSLG